MSQSAARAPLSGRRIMVTRAREQAGELGHTLEEYGAEVLYCPAIRRAAPTDPEPFRRALEQLGTFEWLVLTSVNGALALAEELERQGLDERACQGLRVACVGPATARALEALRIHPVVMPDTFVGAAIAEALAPGLLPGARVLLARAESANPDLPERLRELGADVVNVSAYRTVPDEDGLAAARAQMTAGGVDLVTFTAPSVVTYFSAAVGDSISGAALAAIGPVTARRLIALGFEPAIVAMEHTTRGLVDAITDLFASQRTIQ